MIQVCTRTVTHPYTHMYTDTRIDTHVFTGTHTGTYTRTRTLKTKKREVENKVVVTSHSTRSSGPAPHLYGQSVLEIAHERPLGVGLSGLPFGVS